MTETTKTEEKPTRDRMIAELVGTAAPLALVPPPVGPGYVTWQAPPLTAERKDFIKRQFTPVGCSDLEFEFFLAYCERTGLDPVLKQAYLIERKQNVNGRWVSKFEPMTSEAGMAARADAMPDFRGIDDGVVYEGDEFAIDYSAGTVRHIAQPLKRGRIIGAWAHVHREGRRVPITWLRVEERIQTKADGNANMFWSKMTATQILKCARAEQWRQGWPNIFGGQFVPEEMRDEEIDVTPETAEQAARPTTDKLADRLKASAPTPAPASPPPARTVTVEVTASKPVEAPKAPRLPIVDEAPQPVSVVTPPATTPVEAPKPAEAPKPVEAMPAVDQFKGPLLVFGPKRGTAIERLTGPELLEMIGLGEAKAGSSQLTPPQAAKVRACIDALKAEEARREALLGGPAEPGSEG